MSIILQQLRAGILSGISEVSVESSRARVVGFTESNRAVSVEMLSGTPTDVEHCLAEVHDPQAVIFTPEALWAYLAPSAREVTVDNIPVLQVPEWDGDRVIYFGRLGPEIESGSVAVETLRDAASRFGSVVAFAEGSANIPQ